MKRPALLLLVLLVLAAAAVAVARVVAYRGEAKPGVSVLGIDVGGKSRSQIESRLSKWAREPVTIRAIVDFDSPSGKFHEIVHRLLSQFPE